MTHGLWTTANGDRSRDAIVQFISEYFREHQYPPTVREIGDACGLSSTSTVHSHLKLLERHGRIKRANNRQRTILVIDPFHKEVE